MSRRSLYWIVVGIAVLAAAGVYYSLHRSVKKAIEDSEAAGAGSGELRAKLVYDGDWRSSLGGGVRALTRVLPVNDAAAWGAGLALATDGGLVLGWRGDSLPSGEAAVLTAVQGLPGTRVLCLAVFRDQLFAGTDDGIAVLDPKRLRSYQFDDPGANHVLAMTVTPQGALLGTRSGLIEYRDGVFRRPALFQDLAKVAVSALTPLSQGLAVGAWDQGLLTVRFGRREEIASGQGIIEPVTALLEDGATLLVGSPLGLLAWQEGKGIQTVVPDLFVSAIVRFRDEIVVAAREEGLTRIAGGRARKETFSGSINNLRVIANELYALGDRGLARCGPDCPELRAPFPGRPETMADNRLTAAARAPDGKLWIGAFENGITVLNPDLSRAADLVEPCCAAVNCIRADADRGLMYVGTSHGLLVYSGLQLRERLTEEQGLIGEVVFDVLPAADGSLTIATNRGITFAGPTGMKSIYTFHGLVNNHVYCLARFGDLLAAGTLGGLCLIQDLRVTACYTVDNSPLRHNWITALHVEDDRLYVATFGGGVVALSPNGEWKKLQGPLDHANVNERALAGRGRWLLAGTFGRGLAVLDLDREEWKFFSGRLTSRNVTAATLWPEAAGGPRWAVATDSRLCLFEAEKI